MRTSANGTQGTTRIWRWRATWRVAWALLLITQILAPITERAVAATVAPANGAVAIKVNRTVPTVTPPSGELVFSIMPMDAEFLRAALFPEPIAPAFATTRQDNRDLAGALMAYHDAVKQTGGADAVDPILSFLATHPDSAWAPVLRLDLGIVYRQTGHFSNALEV